MRYVKIGIAFAVVITLIVMLARFSSSLYDRQFTHNFCISDDQLLIHDLCTYVTIKTTHPAPAYDKAIAFLTRCAQRDGFTSETIQLASGNPVIVITCKGSDPSLPALLLNHHMDVVPAGAIHDWSVDPFAGKIINDVLIARGAQDMKSIGIIHYHAVRKLIKDGVQPQRTIYIVGVPDEERGGFKGTKEFIQTDFFKNMNVGFVLDEGHASGNATALDIKVAERKPIQIEVVSKGTTHHGSHLQAHNAIHTLLDFLFQLVELHKQSQQQTNAYAPGQLVSYNITSLQAGVVQDNGQMALNVIPASATATVDIRVPMGITTDSIVQMLNAMSQKYPTIDYTIKARAQEEPTRLQTDSPLYYALVAACKEHNLSAQDHYFEGASDLRYYLDKDIYGLGLTPFTVKDNIHGVDESVPVEQVIRARNIMQTFLRIFCC